MPVDLTKIRQWHLGIAAAARARLDCEGAVVVAVPAHTPAQCVSRVYAAREYATSRRLARVAWSRATGLINADTVGTNYYVVKRLPAVGRSPSTPRSTASWSSATPPPKKRIVAVAARATRGVPENLPDVSALPALLLGAVTPAGAPGPQLYLHSAHASRAAALASLYD